MDEGKREGRRACYQGRRDSKFNLIVSMVGHALRTCLEIARVEDVSDVMRSSIKGPAETRKVYRSAKRERGVYQNYVHRKKK